MVLLSAAASSDGAPSNAKRCWPHDRYKHNGDIPSRYSDHSKYADCGDCEPMSALGSGNKTDAKCELWFGGQSADGGAGGISHKGWPGLTGVRFQVLDQLHNDRGLTFHGSALSDGLYGRNGSDKLYGEDAADVLWGDSNIQDNGAKQKDTLDGGNGSDWIYASHGRNTIRGGAGNDHITAYYGRGSIDCGDGTDTVTVLKHTPYHVKNCEKVKHPGNG